MRLLERWRDRKLDRLAGLPMVERNVDDLVFVQGISWGWGRIYLFSKDRRAAIINTGHSMYWATGIAIKDEPPDRIRHMDRWQPPTIPSGIR